MKVRENKFLLKPHMRLKWWRLHKPSWARVAKIVLLLQNKETWCRCQWFWGFQRAEGFSKSLGRCTALIFCGFRFALGKRVAHVWGRVAKGWRWVVCFGGFDCVSTRGTLQSLWGAARRRGQKSLAGFRGSANAWHCGGVRKGALQTAFFHMAKAIQSNNRRIKICGTKFKEKKNK